MIEHGVSQLGVEASQNSWARLSRVVLATTLALSSVILTGSERSDITRPQNGSVMDVDGRLFDDIFGPINTEEYQLPHNKPVDAGAIDTRRMSEELPAAVRGLLPRVVKIKLLEQQARRLALTRLQPDQACALIWILSLRPSMSWPITAVRMRRYNAILPSLGQ